MTPIDHGLELKVAVATGSTYLTSGGLVAGSYMDYLNANASAFGVLLATATFVANILFQIFNRRDLLKAQLDELANDKTER